METRIDDSALLVNAALGKILFKLACAGRGVTDADVLTLRSRIAGLVDARQNQGQAPDKYGG